MRNPIIDFHNIKEELREVSFTKDKNELFYELSRSIALAEDFILQDKLNEDFRVILSQVIVDSLALLSSVYDIDEFYDFLDSREHWGLVNGDNFTDHFESLVKPFYQLRCDISTYMLKKGKVGFKVKTLFKLSKFLIYLEEE